jgi:hypothetical protein
MSWRRVHSSLVNTDWRHRDRKPPEIGNEAMSDHNDHNLGKQARQAVFLISTIFPVLFPVFGPAAVLPLPTVSAHFPSSLRLSAQESMQDQSRGESEKLALFSSQTDFTLSLHSRHAPDDLRALDLALTILLRRKGCGLDAMSDTINRESGRTWRAANSNFVV